MRRRDFLRTSALAVAALGTGRAAAPAHAAPAVMTRTKDFIVASPWPQSASGFSDLAFGFTRRLEQAFDGRIKCYLKTRQGGSIDALGRGGADIHIGFEHGNVPHHAAFGYFAGLPGHMGLDSETFSDWLTRGGGQALWDACSAQFGIKSLMIAHTATGGGLWSNDDLPAFSAKKIAAQGIACDVLKGLGAVVSDIDMSAAGAAMASGKVDAIEVAHMIEALETGVAGTTVAAIMPGIYRSGCTLAVSLKRELWDSLDAGAQALVSDVAAEYSRLKTAELRANDRMLRKVLGETHGITFLPPSAALETEISRVAEAVVADIAARDDLSRRINGAYMALHGLSGSIRPEQHIGSSNNADMSQGPSQGRDLAGLEHG